MHINWPDIIDESPSIRSIIIQPIQKLPQIISVVKDRVIFYVRLWKQRSLIEQYQYSANYIYFSIMWPVVSERVELRKIYIQQVRNSNNIISFDPQYNRYAPPPPVFIACFAFYQGFNSWTLSKRNAAVIVLVAILYYNKNKQTIFIPRKKYKFKAYKNNQNLIAGDASFNVEIFSLSLNFTSIE